MSAGGNTLSENISNTSSNTAIPKNAPRRIIIEREFASERGLFDAFISVIIDDVMRQYSRTFDENGKSA